MKFLGRTTFRATPARSAYWFAILFLQIWVALGGPSVAGGPPLPRPMKVVVLGDSLSAGYLLPQTAAFPNVLERLLRADGYDVTVDNAAVSGDTASAALERLDWAIGGDADLVMVELGANDMLRGLDPALTRSVLAEIIRRIREKNADVVLAGMLAAPNLGRNYGQSFDAIFPDLAHEFDLPLYPFFLDGVVTNPKLILSDGMHPNAAGVDVMARRVLPLIEAALKRRAASPS